MTGTGAFLSELATWCEAAREAITDGKFNSRRDCRQAIRLGRAAVRNAKTGEDKAAIYAQVQKALEAAAVDVVKSGKGGKILQPKLVRYFAYRTIIQQTWHKGEKLSAAVQFAFTYLSGRQMTLFGPIRLYFVVGLALVLAFAAAYALGNGLMRPNSPATQVGFLESIYFSGVTLTTLGYGDIRPANLLFAYVAFAEAFLGYLFLGLGVVTIAKYNEVYRPEDYEEDLATFSDSLKRG